VPADTTPAAAPGLKCNTNRSDKTIRSYKHHTTSTTNSLIEKLTRLSSLDDVHSKVHKDDQSNPASSCHSSSSNTARTAAAPGSSFAAANYSSGGASFMRASAGGNSGTGWSITDCVVNSSSSSSSSSFLQSGTGSSSGTGWRTTLTEDGAKQTASDGRTHQLSFTAKTSRTKEAFPMPAGTSSKLGWQSSFATDASKQEINTSWQDSYAIPCSLSYSTSSFQGQDQGSNRDSIEDLFNLEPFASSTSSMHSNITSVNCNDSNSSSTLPVTCGIASPSAGSIVGIVGCSITRFANQQDQHQQRHSHPDERRTVQLRDQQQLQAVFWLWVIWCGWWRDVWQRFHPHQHQQHAGRPQQLQSVPHTGRLCCAVSRHQHSLCAVQP
jgi:hypothetical protein